MNDKTESDAILPVNKLFWVSGEYYLKCPHCGRIRGVNDETGRFGDMLGGQYQDNLCDGHYEISMDANRVSSMDAIESEPCVAEGTITLED